jgi:hypothetical protein
LVSSVALDAAASIVLAVLGAPGAHVSRIGVALVKVPADR